MPTSTPKPARRSSFAADRDEAITGLARSAAARRRYLSAEGLTFSALLAQVRSELVMRHLQESDLPVAEVAGLLGFTAQSSFSHWFHATFGCSATDWRKRMAGQAANRSI
jgi:AraC-like DNA-binding protein